MNEKGLETLQIWQRSLTFVVKIYKEVIPLLPIEEKWCLGNQLRRSAQSIPANLAEGYGRFYYQDSIRFCYIARGSLEETYSHLVLANRLGYISEETFHSFSNEILELRRMINGYINFLRESKRGGNEPGANLGISEDQSSYTISTNPDLDPDDLNLIA